ncbi:DUF1800 family protein [Acidovorax sp. Leaf78]|uniref:DUF1800 domain-containing protein n=1 Tax=Acidovorax sp. Leaf78 TaxID=1736237 RepID=UPI0006F91584|nr:DUF1800 domain-containing protein [Acidovorax sp. Leaf78]KQO24567.1 hypothetical protein ASF16_23050 [Acidovorax sp. Leaf78]
MTQIQEAPRALADAEAAEGSHAAPTAPRPSPLPRDATLAALMASVALAACGGGGGDAATENAGPPSTPTPGAAPAPGATPAPSPNPGLSPAPAPATPSPSPSPAPTSPPPPAPGAGNYAHPTAATDPEAARFLLQAQFSASPTEIAALRSSSYDAWINDQFGQPVGTKGWDWLNQRGYNAVDNATSYYDNTYPGDAMIWQQLMTSSDGLRKRVALALSEICVVSLSGLDFNWRSHAMAHYWDQLVANAFGNFRQLLEDVTLNPAMGYYLNTRGNQKENVASGRQPDENYAREILQLMSIGLVELNQDGTAKRNGSGQVVESYTQSDVTNLARVFTGYDYNQSQNSPVTVPGTTRTVPSTDFTRLPMSLNASLHSTLAATFLGTTVAAGTPGAAALKTALDTIFNHPNVGPFIGKQLIQRLVTSNPSPGYVSRVAGAFNNNGAGVRGDMRAVIKAVLLDNDARSPAGLADPMFGRLREPMLRFVQWGRTFGISSQYGSWKIGDLSSVGTRLAQSPLRSPSVFNFFRPGYVPPSTSLATASAVAPEFQLVNESSVGGYLNYMQGVIRNGIFVNAPDLPNGGSNATNGYDIKAAYTTELAIVADADALVARVNLLMTGGQLSAGTVKLIADALKATAITAASTDNAKRDRVAAAIFLVMASAEYLIQK